MPTDHKSYIIATPNPGTVATSYLLSALYVMPWDLQHHRRFRGFLHEECGASRLVAGRNSIVRAFLERDAEWLVCIDADMGWEPDAIDRLLDAADQYRRPFMGALCFGQKKVRVGTANAKVSEPIPTIYDWTDPEDGLAGFAPLYNYPRNQVVKCDGTGAAFFVVHRRALEKVRDSLPEQRSPFTATAGYPREWFDDTIYKGREFGEDLTFCRRLAEVGVPIHVHTGVKTSHLKQAYLEEGLLDATGQMYVPTWVVVPFKDRADLTSQLVDQLVEQGGWDGLLLFDNGSVEDDTKRWMKQVKDLDRIEVFDAADANIHQMWNAGIDFAQSKSGARFNVAILNNDLILGENFLPGLAEVLRADSSLGAVSPNYDGRDLQGVQHVKGICANRYDGTGGLAGFAFMLRGESGYRFPEALQWWYGDNDMMARIVTSGGKAAIVGNVTVEHVDGGGQTGRWNDPEWADVLEADRQAFNDAWGIKEPVSA